MILRICSEQHTTSEREVLAPLLAAFASTIDHDRTEALESMMSAEVTRLWAMLGTMLDRTPLMVIVTNAHGRVELMNGAAARLLGGRGAEDDHRSVDALLAPESTTASLAASLVGYEDGAEEAPCAGQREQAERADEGDAHGLPVELEAHVQALVRAERALVRARRRELVVDLRPVGAEAQLERERLRRLGRLVVRVVGRERVALAGALRARAASR